MSWWWLCLGSFLWYHFFQNYDCHLAQFPVCCFCFYSYILLFCHCFVFCRSHTPCKCLHSITIPNHRFTSVVNRDSSCLLVVWNYRPEILSLGPSVYATLVFMLSSLVLVWQLVSKCTRKLRADLSMPLMTICAPWAILQVRLGIGRRPQLGGVSHPPFISFVIYGGLIYLCI